MHKTLPWFRSVPNFRPLGGLGSAPGGYLRPGQVYRSELLVGLNAEELQGLRQLGIRRLFDLRNPHEQAAAQPIWPSAGEGVRRLAIAEELPVAGADLRQLVAQLNAGRLSGQDAERIMRQTYRQMPQHFADMLAQLFACLAEEGDGAVLIHCTAGKDRTGFVCAMLLHTLGVSRETIENDYLDSARWYTLERLLARLDPALAVNATTQAALGALVQVRTDYLDEALRSIDAEWGSVAGYLRQRVGLNAATQERLRARLLV